MTVRDGPDDPLISLASLPATSRHRRLVLAVAAIQIVGFAVVAPFAATPLPQLYAFIPSLQAIIFVNDVVTSALLFAQFAIVPSRSILALASGYLFTSLIVIPHALSFPGALAPTDLLGLGTNTPVWLYTFWHIGLSAFVIAYVYLKSVDSAGNMKPTSAASAIRWSVATVVALVCVLAWGATLADRFLPPMIGDDTRTFRAQLHILNGLILLFGATALALLWASRRSVLDYWLMLVVWALLSEAVLSAVFGGARFSLGWYAARVFSLVTSIIVLVLLLEETTRLYARLARSTLMLERERDSKLVSLDAVMAAIAHEIRQPLGAIAANADAGVLWLNRAPPNLDEARATFQSVAADSHRVNEVIQAVRAMFAKSALVKAPFDANDLIRETITFVRSEQEAAGIVIELELTPQLPPIHGHRVQIQEVILNLVANAADAMRSVTDRARVLAVKSAAARPDSVAITVKDSGPGIDEKNINRIFDAFFTTKTNSMGMGLAICRSIVEAHGGRLSASPVQPYGSAFQVTLPAREHHGDAAVAGRR